MVWGLGACSLSQQEPSQQVRVVISPDALRSSRVLASPRTLEGQAIYASSQPSTDPQVPTDPSGDSYFLINVEGPGIPFMPMPGFPCIRLGLGTSVFVDGTEKDVPIELWVPAGADRKITVYDMYFLSGSPSVPASGESATQFFAGGAAAFDPPFVYGSAFIPNLSGEQNIEIKPSEHLGLLPLVCEADGGVGFTIAPPVLSANGYQLRNYSPYIAPSIGEQENMSGPLKVWAMEDGETEWLLRLKGLLFNSTGTSEVFMQLEDPLASSPQESGNSLVFDSDIGLWFQDSYFIGEGITSVTHRFLDESLSPILERTIPLAWTNYQSPVKLLPGPAPVPVLIGGAAVYKLVLKNFGSSSALKPLRVHSVFLNSLPSATDNPITVIARPASLSSAVMECPRETPGSASILNFGSGETCEIYVRVQNAPTAAISVRLEIEVASLTEGQDQSFRLAQFVASLPVLADPLPSPAEPSPTPAATPADDLGDGVADPGPQVTPTPTPVPTATPTPTAAPTPTATPVPQARFLGVSQIASGANFTCAIRGTGPVGANEVYCWGSNANGQLGAVQASTPSSSVPRLVPLVSGNVLNIAAGSGHACAVVRPAPDAGQQPSDQIWCWGKNNYGQLGNVPTIMADFGDSPTPQRVGLPTPPSPSNPLTVTKVVAGENHTCALFQLNDINQVYCWGVGGAQIGRNSISISSANAVIPTSVSPNLLTGGGSVVDLFSGPNHACLQWRVSSTDQLYCWGLNGTQQLSSSGNPLLQPTSGSPVISNALSWAGGGGHSCSVTADSSMNRAICRGDNGYLQSGGDAAQTILANPNLIMGLTAPIAVTAGQNHSCAIDASSTASTSGGVKCWGSGTFGELGNEIVNSTVSAYPVAGLGSSSSGVIQISAGYFHTCAIIQEVGTSANNSVKCWGTNNSGRLGSVLTSGVGYSAIPVEVSAPTP